MRSLYSLMQTIMKSSKVKNVLSYLPEFTFLGLGLYGVIDSLLFYSGINWAIFIVSILFITLFTMLLIGQSRILASTLSLLLGGGCVYMLLALLSEYHEFPPGSLDGKTMLITGSLIFGYLLIMACSLAWKYCLRGLIVPSQET